MRHTVTRSRGELGVAMLVLASVLGLACETIPLSEAAYLEIPNGYHVRTGSFLTAAWFRGPDKLTIRSGKTILKLRYHLVTYRTPRPPGTYGLVPYTETTHYRYLPTRTVEYFFQPGCSYVVGVGSNPEGGGEVRIDGPTSCRNRSPR